jgi:uncharacterized protein YndB with AHSA1/START domain
MVKENHIAKAEIKISANEDKVWNALITPAMIKKYMFGTHVVSDWKEGSRITWEGEWQGRPYKDKGTILEIKPKNKLKYSHFSPLSGLPDIPENYHNITISLSKEKNGVNVSLEQDNNATDEERQHSEKNWSMMLADLKKLLEES